MAKKKHVKMQCSACKKVNYYMKKSKGKAQVEKKLDLSKFCNLCRKHTAHKESKK
ncbi:MAG: 50S ribosomal protein L33 [Candidatus Parcubacteria bacterium]|nr:50S ribosomal protein L33 [Candidatus Parcubacteria bacterium]